MEGACLLVFGHFFDSVAVTGKLLKLCMVLFFLLILPLDHSIRTGRDLSIKPMLHDPFLIV